LAVAAVLLLAGFATFAALGIQAALTSTTTKLDQQAVSLRQLRDELAKLDRPLPIAIPWTCAQESASRVHCTETRAPYVTSYVWNLSDGSQLTGTDVHFDLSEMTSAFVRLVAQTPAGPIEAGSQRLTNTYGSTSDATDHEARDHEALQ
jgi:hypothetical protein